MVFWGRREEGGDGGCGGKGWHTSIKATPEESQRKIGGEDLSSTQMFPSRVGKTWDGVDGKCNQPPITANPIPSFLLPQKKNKETKKGKRRNERRRMG